MEYEELESAMSKILRDNNGTDGRHIKEPSKNVLDIKKIDSVLSSIHGNYKRTDVSVVTKKPFVYSSVWFTVTHKDGITTYSKRCGEKLEVYNG